MAQMPDIDDRYRLLSKRIYFPGPFIPRDWPRGWPFPFEWPPGYPHRQPDTPVELQFSLEKVAGGFQLKSKVVEIDGDPAIILLGWAVTFLFLKERKPCRIKVGGKEGYVIMGKLDRDNPYRIGMDCLVEFLKVKPGDEIEVRGSIFGIRDTESKSFVRV